MKKKKVNLSMTEKAIQNKSKSKNYGKIINFKIMKLKQEAKRIINPTGETYDEIQELLKQRSNL